MTYFDKVMRGIRFDDELLAPAEIKRLHFALQVRFHATFGCPGDVFDGAPSEVNGKCPRCLCCAHCWDGEAR